MQLQEMVKKKSTAAPHVLNFDNIIFLSLLSRISQADTVHDFAMETTQGTTSIADVLRFNFTWATLAGIPS